MPRPALRVLAVAVGLAGVAGLALTACSSGSSSPSTSSAGTSSAGTSGDAFPVTMTHTLGTTTIAAKPERVVTYGWGETDAALALGVVPVAMDFQAYGADSKGVLPWVKDKLTAMGAATPEVLPKSTEDPPYEAIAAARPDVILAASSGITAAQYKLLSAIAPTLGYTGKPYTTPWQQLITQTATALGRTAEARTVLAGITAKLAAEASAHPELAGRTMAAVWDVGGVFYVYKKADSRVDFMLDLGLKNAPSVDALANGKESFYYTLSYEQLDKLDTDLLVAYADTPAQMASFLGKSYAKAIPAVRSGAVAQVVGTEKIAAVSPPTALSLPWGLDSLVAQLSAAAKKVDAAG